MEVTDAEVGIYKCVIEYENLGTVTSSDINVNIDSECFLCLFIHSLLASTSLVFVI